ncbi:MAG: enoyl-CoA hydratase-related protein [Solirubrobacteraceae bacterium]
MSATMTELRSSLDEGILTLTFERPESLNSLSTTLLDELAAAALGAADDAGVRCVVLRGAGRCFSSGGALEGDPSQVDVRQALIDHYNPAALALYELTADRALAVGLVNYVVPDPELETATRALARRLADGPYALRQIKRQLRVAASHDLAEQLAFEADVQGVVSKSHDCIEGVEAFLARRAPQFTGR